ncbi:hypothetical protein [Nitrospirillum sp. BR 11163]|uniref:hypothetical protein n=1 Tax=Nitrospirillum sp. BR 11163 TaxID=3104323 RepID=UPI002AFF86AA|nr:hypothetical protein [Nitrospirillum sp. BR 11163]MEA1674649.1 hypothetical protein [Nitrospirillum sp. BR 11163]
MTRAIISYTRCPAVPTISALAYKLGLLQAEFADEPDIQVDHKSVGFSPKIDYGHDERFWIRNAGHAPGLWKQAQGVDSKFVGLSFLDGTYPVISLASSGISDVAALRGRRLVVFKGKSAFDLLVNQQLKIYQTTLATAGLTLDDVELVTLAPPTEFHQVPPGQAWRQRFLDLLQILGDNQADAGTWPVPPDAGDIPAFNVLYDTRLAADPLARVHPGVLRGVVVSGPLLRERPDIVVRVLVRLLEAADFALANPLQALRLIAEDLALAPEAVAAYYENVAQGVALSLEPVDLEALTVQKAFLLKHGLIARDLDLSDIVDPAPLAEARRIWEARRAAGKAA